VPRVELGRRDTLAYDDGAILRYRLKIIDNKGQSLMQDDIWFVIKLTRLEESDWDGVADSFETEDQARAFVSTNAGYYPGIRYVVACGVAEATVAVEQDVDLVEIDEDD
jgi:hypothetical protein